MFEEKDNGLHVLTSMENTVGKGAIACYKQMLLFPIFFKKLRVSGTKHIFLFKYDDATSKLKSIDLTQNQRNIRVENCMLNEARIFFNNQ